MIKDAISRTESKLGYSPKVGFVIVSEKTVSMNIEEYKHRNNIDGNPDFDATFKDALIRLIEEKLHEIKETTIGKRLETFRSLFPDYFEVIKDIIEKKGVRLGEQAQAS